jgi:hypothetical protein
MMCSVPLRGIFLEFDICNSLEKLYGSAGEDSHVFACEQRRRFAKRFLGLQVFLPDGGDRFQLIARLSVIRVCGEGKLARSRTGTREQGSNCNEDHLVSREL